MKYDSNKDNNEKNVQKYNKIDAEKKRKKTFIKNIKQKLKKK